MTVEIVTFGCRLNIFESEVMRRHAREAGLERTVIIHTCAVTAEAERQARQAVRRARREDSAARIVVTGCSAQITAGTYAAMPEVDHVIGNAEKLDATVWRGLATPDESRPKALVGDIMTVRATAGHMVEGFDGRSRAFLQVQQGCDHRCTFCIIPYGRGPSSSVPVAEIVAQARLLMAAGFKELVVTGVDITSWGRDLPGQPLLGTMLRQLLDLLPDLSRLRLSSIDPAEIDPDLMALIEGEPRLLPHLHLSVQAGDDMVLKRMKRRHLRQDVVRVAAELRALRPDVVLGADLIAGFPTETDEMFQSTLDLVDEAGLTFLHVFPYSPRQGTPAARMPQVDKPVRQERAARLRAAGEAALEHFLAREVGRRRLGLVERGGRGHTDHFAPFQLDDPAAAAGQVALLEIDGVTGGLLRARLAA